LKNFKTLRWIGGSDGCLELIDQRKLPAEFGTIQCKTIEQLYDAIKTLAVRGAPAIGVAAAFGVCLAAQEIQNLKISEAIKHLEQRIKYLASSRPTAVNLFWALERMSKKLNEAIEIKNLQKTLLTEAQKIYDEDVEMCRRIGINGEKFITNGSAVLTHCNAGSLATAGSGTALAPMLEAQKNAKKFIVYADETRPLLQGARLTAWELMQAGIDVTLICDNMAASLMKAGKINAILVGADRIAANGDTANKIGTYSLSVLAKAHNIPFYIAAPSTTFDLKIRTGNEIPIEQRAAEEVSNFMNLNTAPEGVKVYNPAFDVTPAENITAIITEKGVIECPTREKIEKLMKS
jgi:methylthioribose-1-phosphate isomerase